MVQDAERGPMMVRRRGPWYIRTTFSLIQGLASEIKCKFVWVIPKMDNII